VKRRGRRLGEDEVDAPRAAVLTEELPDELVEELAAYLVSARR